MRGLIFTQINVCNSNTLRSPPGNSSFLRCGSPCATRCAQLRSRRSLRVMARRNETEEERAARKAAQKAAKAEKRADRQGQGDPAKGRKPCSLCTRPRDLLIRCQVDATGTWHMACGRCWQEASGGQVDGGADRPHYRYGGLWKNHHAQRSGRRRVPVGAGAREAGSSSRGSRDKGAASDGSGSGSEGEGEAEVEGVEGEGEERRGGGDSGRGREGAGGGSVQAMLLAEAAACREADGA